MNRLWSFQTKFVVVLVLLMLGALLLQSFVHDLNKERLFREVEALAQDIANDVTEQLTYEVGKLSRGRILSFPKRKNVWFTVVRHPGKSPQSKRVRLQPNKDLRKLLEKYLPSQNPAEESLSDIVFSLRLFMDPDHANPVLLDSLPPQARKRGRRRGAVEVGSPLTAGVSSNASSLGIEISPYLRRIQEAFNDYRRLDRLATIGIFILGIGVAWLLGVRLTRPVYQLVNGFQGVAEGNLQTRVPDSRRDEFGLLGRQFNHMVKRLAEDRELERELMQKERVQHLGDLAAGVAHDVRNPLNAIYLNIAHIRDKFLPTEESSQERFLHFTSDIQKEVERLNQLVSNFLSLAQPTSGSIEPVYPNSLVEELTRLLSKEAAGRHVELRMDLDENVSALHCSRQELMSAFLNVAINALNAMEPDGGTLDIITGFRSGECEELVITFADSGCGIPEEDLERVFLPYFTTRKGGTGLGMAIARRIAERNGGRMELRSTVGDGTLVSFLFPTVCAENGATESGASEEAKA